MPQDLPQDLGFPQDLLAALDLGSNTFRLILARLSNGAMDVSSRRVWQEIPRISEGLSPGGRFGEAPKARCEAVLRDFSSVLSQSRPSRVLAGGTMAFRESADGKGFLRWTREILGCPVWLLSGEDEARLSALGVLSGLDPIPAEGLIMDIGGRSTELIATSGKTIKSTQSLPVGVVGLTEDHVKSDPLSSGDFKALEGKMREALSAADWSRLGPNPTLVGTAGTFTTLAAMLMELEDYDPNLINNSSFAKKQIEDLLKKLSPMTSAQRMALPGLHPRRADVIAAGLAEALSTMEFLDLDRLVVSDNSLLEGLWLAAAGLIENPFSQSTEVAP